jgi:peptidoglycan/LPS O-acetylase OafA/YrhL
MYFYLLFALGMLLGRRWFGWVIAAWSVLTLALHLLFPKPANPYLGLVSSLMNLEFVFGIVIGYALVGGRMVAPRRVLAAGVVALAGLFVVLSRPDLHEFPSEEFRVFGVGLAMALIVYGAVGLEVLRGWRCPAFLQRWGSASYSLYLIHIPALTALGMVVAKVVTPSPRLHAIGIVAVPAFLVVCSLILYRFVEHPLQQFFHRNRRRPTAASDPVEAAQVASGG